jgi:hypothetical protein
VGLNPTGPTIFATIAQWIEQQISNLSVAGSSPAGCTNGKYQFRDHSSMVEQDAFNILVGGSSPSGLTTSVLIEHGVIMQHGVALPHYFASHHLRGIATKVGLSHQPLSNM